MHHSPHLFSAESGHQRQRAAGANPSSPSAFVLPTTRLTVEEAVRLHTRDGMLIVGSDLTPNAVRPAQALSLFHVNKERPLVALFTDQIIEASASMVLVRTDEGDRFLSPIEAILNSNYGYRLAVWTRRGFRFIEPNGADMHTIIALLVCHLDDARTLGEAWEASELQVFRQPEVREFNARRRLRAFRSAIAHAFLDDSRSPLAASLMAKADAIEARMAAAPWS